MREEFIQINGRRIPYIIVKRKRKNLTIVISPGGKVEIRIPTRIPYRDAVKFAQDHKEWIHKKVILTESSLTATRLKFDGSDTIWIQGEQLPLLLNYQNRLSKRQTTIEFNNAVIITVNPDNFESPMKLKQYLLQKFVKFIKERTYALIEDKLQYWSKEMDLEVPNFEIRYFKRRLGANYSQNYLKFNYKLLFAPENVVDYVVIHELAHMRFSDHSARFWNYVKQFYPDIKQIKTYIKKHQGSWELELYD